MGRNKATTALQREAMIEDRRARVASFKCQGMSIRQIEAAMASGKILNPDTGKAWSRQAIRDDLDYLTAKWQADAKRDIGEFKACELAELDVMEQESWESWRLSRGKHQVRTTKTGRVTKDGDPIDRPEVSTRVEALAGDPRFLQIILDCKARRAAILGLDAPKNMTLNGEVTLGSLLSQAKGEGQ